MTSPIDQVIAEAERKLSTRYMEYWIWDPINRRRRISLRHIMRDYERTYCGLSAPTLTVTYLSREDTENTYSDMVCRRCKASYAQ